MNEQNLPDRKQLIDSDREPTSNKANDEPQPEQNQKNDGSSGFTASESPKREEDSSSQNVVGEMTERITRIAGIEPIQGFSLSAMFSETFKKRSEGEIEEYFTVGTELTTPSIEDVFTSWPRPWVFFRMLVGTLIIFFGFVQAWQAFGNSNLIPGLIIVGSFAVPISTLVLFFEVNVRKNVSLYQTIRLLFLGGILSLIFTLFLFEIATPFRWIGASLAGLVEEPGKLMALLLVVNISKYRYTLNGLLFGAAVGTGFAAFESSGYALNVLLALSPEAMLNNIMIRGVLSPFGHIAWTAMCAAALWKVKGTKKFEIDMLKDPRFYKVFWIAVGLHMLWNTPIRLPFFGKFIILGFVAWTVVLGLIQDGLKQLRAEKIEALEPEPSSEADEITA